MKGIKERKKKKSKRKMKNEKKTKNTVTKNDCEYLFKFLKNMTPK